MSVLIKGMEMPKNCLECWNCDRNFRDEEGELIKDWRCLLLFEHVDDGTNTRLNGCPLIELPDHGDLIDRDALNATDSWEWIRHGAPVIIPAERSEE